MSEADAVALEYAKENGTLGLDYNQIYDAAKYGYRQAEEDLKLTWQDIALIETISKEFIKNNTTPMTDRDYYQEVLKRFKNLKHVK